MLDWDDFKYFSAVAHAGSVRGAGKDLGVHPSTVTRRLEQFEQRLGIRLFARTRGGLVITPEGAEVVDALDEVATQLQEIEQRLQGRDATLAGLVRVNVPEVFVPELFMPELAIFASQHPDVVVEIERSWQPANLDKREGDLSILLTDEPPDYLIGRPIGRMSMAAFRLADAAPGVHARWLDSALERAVAPGYAARSYPDYSVSGHLGSVSLQLAAVLAGMGTTLLPAYLGDDDARLSRVALSGGEGGEGGEGAELHCGIWLLAHPESRGVARVQAVSELMLDTLRSHELDTRSGI